MVDYEEFKAFIDDDMEIQDFVLKYSGVQTIVRAMKIYNRENEDWKNFFESISVDYCGSYFVEFDHLKREMEKKLKDIDPTVRKRLYYIFSYEG